MLGQPGARPMTLTGSFRRRQTPYQVTRGCAAHLLPLLQSCTKMRSGGVCGKQSVRSPTAGTALAGDMWAAFLRAFGGRWLVPAFQQDWPTQYLKYVVSTLKHYKLLTKLAKRIVEATERGTKRPAPTDLTERTTSRPAPYPITQWEDMGTIVTLLIQGDNKNTIQWAKGAWTPSEPRLDNYLTKIHEMAEELHRLGVRPRQPEADLFEHILREHNSVADAAGRTPINRFEMKANICQLAAYDKLVVRYDGGAGAVSSNCSVVIFGHNKARLETDDDLTLLAIESWLLPKCPAIDAELTGLYTALRALRHFFVPLGIRRYIYEPRLPEMPEPRCSTPF